MWPSEAKMRPYKTLMGPQEPQMGPAVCGGSNRGPLEALGGKIEPWKAWMVP